MTHHDIVIVGGGPAELTAAMSARRAGVEGILILECDSVLGGILNQCIHNRLGLHIFKEELTGPEHAARYIDTVKEVGIPCKSNIIVIEINQGKEVTYINRENSPVTIRVRAVILAMGCRERPRGAPNISGYRSVGIYSAGTAQRLMNIEGPSVEKEVVILGSGDIGLIMAGRMTLEGAKVKVIAELMLYSGGSKWNTVQCLDGYGISLKLSHAVIDIQGKEWITGTMPARADENRKPIPGTEEHCSCDTLLLSVGLISENELAKVTGVSMSPVAFGPNVNDRPKTGVEGIYACGNMFHAHDLVGYVSGEAALASANAAVYVTRSAADDNVANDDLSGSGAPSAATAHNVVVNSSGHPVLIQAEDGARCAVPQTIDIERMGDKVIVRFCAADIYKDHYVVVLYDGTVISKRKKRVPTSGGTEQTISKKESSADYPDSEKIMIRMEVK